METGLDSVTITINAVAKDTSASLQGLIDKIGELQTKLKDLVATSKQLNGFKINMSTPEVKGTRNNNLNSSNDNQDDLQQQLKTLHVGNLDDSSYAKLQKQVLQTSSAMNGLTDSTEKYLLSNQNVVTVNRQATDSMDKYRVTLTKNQSTFGKYGSLEEQLSKFGLQDLFNVDATGLVPLENGITKISDTMPDVTKHMEQYRLDANKVLTVNTSLENGVHAYKLSLDNLAQTHDVVNGKLEKFGANMSRTLAEIWIIHRAVSVLTQLIGKSVSKAADYEEAFNLFTVTMGEYGEQGLDWVNKFSKALYLDPSNVMQYMGTFNSLIKGLGVGADKAYLMSQNLTQLTYDLASFKNLDIDTAFRKIQSGISGKVICLIRKGLRIVTNLIQWNSKHVMV